MICELPDGVLTGRLREAARRLDVPFSATFELTRRCCFRCVHCYAGPGIGSEQELDTAQWRGILDETAAAGALRVILTGGEPLIRPDFSELYTHACRAGLRVSVFTNAAAVDDEVISLFQRYPPAAVDVTVYGLSGQVATAVTGVAEACSRQWAGIHRLRDAGLALSLKAIALRQNEAEIDAIEAAADALGVPFRFSTDIGTDFNGSCAPLGHRLCPEATAALETRTPVRRERLRELMQPPAASGRGRYRCRTGETSFFIGADGCLQSCIGVRYPRQSVLGRPLLPVWRGVRDAVRRQELPLAPDGPFQDNDYQLLRYLPCPAFVYDERGELAEPVWEQEKQIIRQRLLALNGKPETRDG